MFGSKGVEAVDRITESTRVTDMFPSKSCQTRCRLLVTNSTWQDNMSKGCLRSIAGIQCVRVLTAQRCDWSVDRLHEGAFAVELHGNAVS